MKFLVVYEKAPNNYCAFAPNLPVICMSTGETVEEIRQNIREAMNSHIEFMILDGDPLDEPSSWSEEMEIRSQEGGPSQKCAVTFEESPFNCAAFVRKIPGCVSVGDTREQVRENIRHIIQFHLYGTAADGCYIPEPEAWAEIVEVPLPVPVEGIPATGA